MKKILLFILPIGILVLGCSNQLNNEKIIGEWQITNFETNAELSPFLINSTKKTALSSIYQFYSNHKFSLTDSYNPDGLHGEWNLDLESNQIELYFNNKNRKPTTYKIIEFTINKMIWNQNMGEYGQSSYTLEKSSDTSASKSPVTNEEDNVTLSTLDNLSNSASAATEEYCKCMKESVESANCMHLYDSARMAINKLRDLAKKEFNIENEFVKSDNKYIQKVQRLRGQIGDCQLHDNEMIYESPPSEN